MANFAAKINRSIRGRDLGFQDLSSAESGGAHGITRFLAGTVVGVRGDVTSAESTATNLKAYGLSQIGTTSTAVSHGFTLDPPIPGVEKLIALSCGASDGAVLVKTANSEVLYSTAGSSFTTFTLSTRAIVSMVGLTTGIWFVRETSAKFTLLATAT